MSAISAIPPPPRRRAAATAPGASSIAPCWAWPSCCSSWRWPAGALVANHDPSRPASPPSRRAGAQRGAAARAAQRAMPIVTLVTLLFGELLAGAVLTEQVFTIPGFGKLVVDAVFTRDYAVVRAWSVRGGGLHPDEPAGRHPVHPGQSPPEARMSAISANPPPPQPQPRLGQVQAQSHRHAGPIVLFFVALACWRRWSNHDPSRPASPPSAGAVGAILAGHGRAGPRHLQPHGPWRARSLMAGLVSVLIALVGVPFGLARLFRRLDRQLHLARHRGAAGHSFLILAIALAAFLGPSLMNAMIAIGVSAAPSSSA